MSYPIFARKPKVYSRTLDEQAWKIVVCDEAHYLRNPTSQRTKALLPVLQTALRVVLVTGTPTPKQASEAYTLLHGLRPLGCTFKEWCNRYGAGCTERREAEVAAMLAEVMVRHRKADVLEQLPPRRRQRVELQLPATAAAALRKFQQEGCTDEEHFRQLARVKEAAAQDYVEYLIDASAEKFVLFGHHRAMLNAVESVIDKRGVGFIRIDGSTPVSERLGLVHRFQTESSCRVAVLSILAAGEGLTLTAAALCVFCELCPAVPGVIEQAEARIHRIGQKASRIDVHFLVVDGTRDDRVFSRLESRTDEVAQAIGGAVPDAGARLDLNIQARMGPHDGASSLTSISQRPSQGAEPVCVKPLARQMPASASQLPTAPKKKRRKPGFDLSSVLHREITRAKADFAACSMHPHGDQATTDPTGGGLMRIPDTSQQCLTRLRAPEVPEAQLGSARMSASTVPATASVPLDAAQARLSAGDMALAFFASGTATSRHEVASGPARLRQP